MGSDQDIIYSYTRKIVDYIRNNLDFHFPISIFTFQLIGEDAISVKSQWDILDTLYDINPVISATVVVVCVSIFSWSRNIVVEAEIWIGSSLSILVFRLILSRAYRLRSSTASPRVWMDRYFLAVVLTGFQWGLGGLVLAHSQDGTASSAVFAVEAALMAAAAARGYAFPSAVLTQVNLTALTIIVFSACAGQYVFVVLLALYMIHQTTFIMSLMDIKLREVNADSQRRSLISQLAHANEQLSDANANLSVIAATDALTGISNRRSFDNELPLRWAEALQMGTALSLLLIDVDHFKQFNDTHGHPAGDTCLASVAAAITSVVRHASDHAARYGGEEFALILPDSDGDTAEAVAERLTAAVRLIRVPVSGTQEGRVTVSVGIGALKPDGGSNLASLIDMADRALYRAKQDGRDCVR